MFRRASRTEVWHSTPACRFWPAASFEEEETPSIGIRCANCLRLESVNRGDGVSAAMGRAAEWYAAGGRDSRSQADGFASLMAKFITVLPWMRHRERAHEATGTTQGPLKPQRDLESAETRFPRSEHAEALAKLVTGK